MSQWIGALRCMLDAEPEAMVVAVASTRGSAPREAGARMLVGAHSVHGTVGGGHLEFEAIRIARDALATKATRGNWLVRFPLAARLGQCCGGVASLLFQPVGRAATWPERAARLLASDIAFALVTRIGEGAADPQIVTVDAPGEPAALVHDICIAARSLTLQPAAHPALINHDGSMYLLERIVANDFRVVLFGNGHVGRALTHVLGTLPCIVTWVDQREHAFPAEVPANVSVVATDTPEDAVHDAKSHGIFLVMTHSHALDFELTASILTRGDFSYFGLIGSASKRAQFERRLVARGFADDALQRLTCPIGVGTIRSKEPGAIAVAVAAQILALREAAADLKARTVDPIAVGVDARGKHLMTR